MAHARRFAHAQKNATPGHQGRALESPCCGSNLSVGCWRGEPAGGVDGRRVEREHGSATEVAARRANSSRLGSRAAFSRAAVQDIWSRGRKEVGSMRRFGPSKLFWISDCVIMTALSSAWASRSSASSGLASWPMMPLVDTLRPGPFRFAACGQMVRQVGQANMSRTESRALCSTGII